MRKKNMLIALDAILYSVSKVFIYKFVAQNRLMSIPYKYMLESVDKNEL